MLTDCCYWMISGRRRSRQKSRPLGGKRSAAEAGRASDKRVETGLNIKHNNPLDINDNIR